MPYNNLSTSSPLITISTEPKEYGPEATPKDPSSDVFAYICVIIFAVVYGYLVGSCVQRRKKHLYQGQSGEMPCKQCSFFNENVYLQCAVNPKVVLTPQAKDCRDYQSRR